MQVCAECVVGPRLTSTELKKHFYRAGVSAQSRGLACPPSVAVRLACPPDVESYTDLLPQKSRCVACKNDMMLNDFVSTTKSIQT